MAAKREKIHFETVEELLGAPVTKDATTEIRIDQIYPFVNHPFKVVDDDKMSDLVQSIRDNGVIVPVLVRPDDEGTYEMISGHRRMHAAKLAGLTTIPAIIKPMTNDEATIAMVDANMQREEILPSERAFSLKMKMDAMRRQGYRSDLEPDSDDERQVDEASATQWRRKETAQIVGEEAGLGKSQVKKYIRLTELIPELLDMVDNKHLAIALAVEISYFSKEVQHAIYVNYKETGAMTKEQIQVLKKQTNLENATEYTLKQLLNSVQPEIKEAGRISFTRKKLDQYFPKNYTMQKRQEIIFSLLDGWKNRQEGADV